MNPKDMATSPPATFWPCYSSGPGSWNRPGPNPCGIVNTAHATCYLSSFLQAFAHVPVLSNLSVETWKEACGCLAESHCWSCYMGVWIHSRQSVEKACATNRPDWALRRLHLIYAAARNLGRVQCVSDSDKVELELPFNTL